MDTFRRSDNKKNSWCHDENKRYAQAQGESDDYRNVGITKHKRPQ